MGDVDWQLFAAALAGVLAVVLVTVIAHALRLSYAGWRLSSVAGLLTGVAIATAIRWRFGRRRG